MYIVNVDAAQEDESSLVQEECSFVRKWSVVVVAGVRASGVGRPFLDVERRLQKTKVEDHAYGAYSISVIK